jgi:hypothetical protein
MAEAAGRRSNDDPQREPFLGLGGDLAAGLPGMIGEDQSLNYTHPVSFCRIRFRVI